MLKDWNHDLVHQLSETSDSIWRMEEYAKNSTGCDQCTAMWKEMKISMEEMSKKLAAEIGHHYRENRFE